MAAELKQNYPRLQGLVNTHMIGQRDGEDAAWRVGMHITSLNDWQRIVAHPQFRGLWEQSEPLQPATPRPRSPR
jgi:hypothetical protein